MLGHYDPTPSKTSHFALKTKILLLAEIHQEGSKKNCHEGFGSQKLKLRVLGLLLDLLGHDDST